MYLNWDTKIITDFSPENIEKMYDAGYVFTRVDKGVMNKTRSLRIKLSDFELSSENRRILKKVENLKLETSPIPYKDYSWEIGKLAKDFYEKHDADFSANKVKGILTDGIVTNFNKLLVFSTSLETESRTEVEPPLGGGSTSVEISTKLGYSICYESPKILHYSYPFYKSDSSNPSLGLGMMIMAINYAKDSGKEYIYLGSLQRPSDTYKLQFSGQEWFDNQCATNADETRNEHGKNGCWQTDTAPLREILK